MNRFILPCTILLALAVSSFAGDPPKTAPEAEAKAKVDALREAQKSGDVEKKLAAVDECGNSPHAMTASALLTCFGDPAEDVRIRAAGALGKMARLPEAAQALHSALPGSESKPQVASAIFAAMEKVGVASSVTVAAEWAMKRLSKKDEGIVATVDAAISCLGGLKFKESVKQLIEIKHKAEVSAGSKGRGTAPPVDNRPETALTRLTGEKLGKTAAWEDWWKKTGPTLNDDLTPKQK